MIKIIKWIYRSLYSCTYAPASRFIQKYFRTIHAQNNYISQVSIVVDTHKETFGSYKNLHRGKKVAIIATGPSLKNYKPIQGVINIGVNRAFLADNVSLDYLFMIDYLATKSYINELEKYPDIKKFFGILPKTPYGFKEEDTSSAIIPESIAVKYNAKRFYTYSKRPQNPCNFNKDIDKTWLADGGSSVFSALQFALFTNPEKLYIVGCDCSAHFLDRFKGRNSYNLRKTWQEFKKFSKTYYPETEVISINPIGLKGLFKDECQTDQSEI